MITRRTLINADVIASMYSPRFDHFILIYCTKKLMNAPVNEILINEIAFIFTNEMKKFK